MNRRAKPKNELALRKGHKITVPNHPTEFCAQPWFPLVLRIRNPSTSITFGEVYNSLVSQLSGISFAGGTAVIRVFSLRVWGPIPTTNTALVVTFRDVFEDFVGSSAIPGNLEIIENYADQVNRARVGYEYSTIQQQKTLFIGAAISDQLAAITGAGVGSVAYLKLLWRPFPTPTVAEGNSILSGNDINTKLVLS
jgi:hypothetical protein